MATNEVRKVCTLDMQARSNHKKAARAPANKLARICHATFRDKEPFGEGQRLSKKINSEIFVMPAGAPISKTAVTKKKL